MLTDPIADMLTRIRNANRALHETAQMPTSRMKVEIARLLKEEGYIKDYRVEKGESPPKPHLLLTRYDPARVTKGDMMKVEDVLEILSIPLLGIVPESPTIL